MHFLRRVYNRIPILHYDTCYPEIKIKSKPRALRKLQNETIRIRK